MNDKVTQINIEHVYVYDVYLYMYAYICNYVMEIVTVFVCIRRRFGESNFVQVMWFEILV